MRKRSQLLAVTRERGLQLLLCLLAVRCAFAQTRAADVKAVWKKSLDSITDLHFTAIESLAPEQWTEVWLVTQPEWQYWKYHRRYASGKAESHDLVVAWDGEFLRQLQSDGLGRLTSRLGGESYMVALGMYLSNWGPAPKDAKGRRLSWLEQLFNNPAVEVTDDSEHPGLVIVRSALVCVRVDPEHAYSPTTVTWQGTDGVVLSEVQLGDYRRIDGLWVPFRLDDKKTSYSLTIRDVHANQGLSRMNMRVEFPLGTSLLLDNDVVRVAGQSGGVEEEAALQSWLMYGSDFRRVPPNVAARASNEWVSQPSIVSIAIITGNCVISGLLAYFTIRHKRRGNGHTAFRTVIPLITLTVAACAQSTVSPEPDHSAAYSSYIVLDAYGRTVPLSDLAPAEPSTGSGPRLAAAAKLLEKHGIYTRIVAWPTAQLSKWPYPTVVALRAVGPNSQERCGVVLTAAADQFTMFDPGQYGMLAPWNSAYFQERYEGEALLTSPVPIESRDSIASISLASFLLPSLALVGLCVVRSRTRRTPAVVALVSLFAVIGCSREPGQAQRTSGIAGDCRTRANTPEIALRFPRPPSHRHCIVLPDAPKNEFAHIMPRPSRGLLQRSARCPCRHH